MKASAGQIRAAVDKPDAAVRLYLFHGPDEAGAADLAERLARALGPDVERVDLDMKALREQPGRLADEAASLSLFGGARYVRLSGVEEAAAEAVSLLLGAERAGNPVIAIGPGLKASGKLVKQAIAAQTALSFACYVPEGIDATRLATAVAREHGLRLTGERI
jgi:DNA polymerase III subunit delta